MLNIRTFTFNLLQERTYVAWQGEGSCVVVDPGCYGPAELQALEDLLQDRFGGIPVYMHPADEAVFGYGAEMAAGLGLAPAATDFLRTPVRDGQVLEAAGIRFEVIATPGHTPGGVCYLVREADILFTGDTLFAGSIGRTDFPGGEYDDLIRSIMERVILLDPEIRILPGHGPTSTIGQERTGNPFLEPFNEPEEEPDPDLEPVVISRE